ncbi:MAG: hypothetical protein QN155_02000 [Armatimonadota bacterium]|nr:hypothetical protein [Armatimonadota bacterium]MDR7403452.1 hypothetical protein [Armatimonadota bacterium]
MTLDRVSYAGWEACLRLATGDVELIIPTAVGPRVIRFAFTGGENEFAEFPDDLGRTGGTAWRIYGGHRLWHAPEQFPRTYAPDNDPVAWEPLPDGVRLIQPVEATTGVQKEIEIRLAPRGARVDVTHRLRNHTPWTIELAPWALTAMAPGGVAVIPLPPRGRHPQHLQPTGLLSLWPYTDLADPRWTWGTRYVLLRQDPARSSPQKVGILAPDGWAAYARAGRLFVKTFPYVPGARYPDLGCCVEAFANDAMLELETLGPLTALPPGGDAVHHERWFLFRDVPPPRTDADVEAAILPRVRDALAAACASPS